MNIDDRTEALERELARRAHLKTQNVERMFSRKNMEQGFLECFELIGGVPRLAMWANEPENYEAFLKLLMRFAPKEASENAGQVLNYISNVPQSPLNRRSDESSEPLEIEHEDE